MPAFVPNGGGHDGILSGDADRVHPGVAVLVWGPTRALSSPNVFVTVSKLRLSKKTGMVSAQELGAIERAILVQLAIGQ